MPLPPLLEQKLRTARPEYPRLSEDEFCQLRAYLECPDRPPLIRMSVIQRCKMQGLPLPNFDPEGVGPFLAFMTQVCHYNLRVRLVGAEPEDLEAKIDPNAGTRLRISSWAELGIGWDGQQSFAFVPAPQLGSRVSKSQGKALSLTGLRWQVILR